MIRLLELREEKGLNQRQAAKTFFVSQSTYNNWENAKTQPSIEQLIAIANYFSVSVDYLIGNTDDYYTGNKGQVYSAKEIALLKKILTLPEDLQASLENIIYNLTE